MPRFQEYPPTVYTLSEEDGPQRDAYRWLNYDGTKGGIVAVNAIVDESAYISLNASIGHGAIVKAHAIVGDAYIGEGTVVEEAEVIPDHACVFLEETKPGLRETVLRWNPPPVITRLE